jgi:hypothetical protein
VPSETHRDLLKSASAITGFATVIVVLVLTILASRYTWKLERRWFPDRISHPLFGRWLEWKGRA